MAATGTPEGTIRALHGGAATAAGPKTEGMSRRTEKIDEGVLAAETSMEPQTMSGWHHHGDHTAYVYVAQGELRIEWGRGGRESLELTSGDFYVIPPRMVHREGNPGSAQQTVVHGFFVGTGPEAMNVDGPEAVT